MPYPMTEKDDQAKVDFKTIHGDFTVTIGTIPAAIGEKIEACHGKTMTLFRSALTSENQDIATIEAKQSAREAAVLLCKYGVRGHTGLETSKGVAIPCVTLKEEGTGYTILDEKTLDLYVGNEAFLETVTDKLVVLKRVGIARYNLEGEDALKKATEEGEDNAAPFINELEKSLGTSTSSAKENEQA